MITFLLTVWRRLGLWRWREARVCRWGFSTPWLSVWASRNTRQRVIHPDAPRHVAERDWSAMPTATHHRFYLDWWFILVVVPHDNWYFPLWEAAHSAGRDAQLDLYWEAGSATLCPFTPREYRWLQRRVYVRAFLRQWQHMLTCWMYGHSLAVDAFDAENGSEDISCNRCGWSHHAQF